MDFLTPELELALVTFAAVVAAQFSKGLFRMIQSFVKGTPTKLDDKLLAAVEGALKKTHVVRVVDKLKKDEHPQAMRTKTTQAAGGTSESITSFDPR